MENILLEFHKIILKNNGDKMQRVINFLENELILKENDVIVLGNSYGPDSMALLNVLLNII